jgi:hypothetical protein
MDQNFDVLCRELLNIEIIINNYVDTQHSLREDTYQFPASIGTPSNPIMLVEEPNAQRDRCYW